MAAPRTPSILLLGRDHPVYGEYRYEVLGDGRTVAAISVGADEASPSLRGKGDPTVPNEDALLARDDGARVFMAVADAHFGTEASHLFLEALHANLVEVPASPAALETLFIELEPIALRTDSSTTLLVAVLDRAGRQGFGLSFGDSSLAVVGRRGARIVNVREVQYVDPSSSRTYHPHEGYAFHFATFPGELVLAFTDGIDQCHYRSPRTSVTLRHLAALYGRTGPDPELYASGLMEMALLGVDGHPGGQDNAALVVSLA